MNKIRFIHIGKINFFDKRYFKLEINFTLKFVIKNYIIFLKPNQNIIKEEKLSELSARNDGNHANTFRYKLLKLNNEEVTNPTSVKMFIVTFLNL